LSETALQVAMSQQRVKVPEDYQLVFADWSNDALLSLTTDMRMPLKVRAYAGWELDFRNAFGIEIAMPRCLLSWSGKVPIPTSAELASISERGA
jgi:hypothetical protein